MKRVAIITLNGYFNYGNRLQNYALQEALSSLGCSVLTLRFDRNTKQDKHKIFLKKAIKTLTNPLAFNKERNRQKNFIGFSRDYIAESKKIYNIYDDLTHLNNEFDHFVVGSDQVWNPSMNRLSSFYFLDFAEEDKRIAYAPSFGVSDLSESATVKYKEWINGIPYLSVREDEGARIIKDLTGREAPVLVDPTLLLPKEKWLNVAKSSRKPAKGYLLTYFLGEIPDEYRKHINAITETEGVEIFNLGDIRKKEAFLAGPSEFINYINDCSVLCTDSFHGAVFAILLEKLSLYIRGKGQCRCIQE